MRWSRVTCLALFGAAIFVLNWDALAAQDAKDGKPVTFITGDRVEIKGKFYPGKDGANSPTVMMLHALGEDSGKAEWVTLAKELQNRGYAVLTFDFRGHGESVNVEPGIPNKMAAAAVKGFWDERENVAYLKDKDSKLARERKGEIDYKNFKNGYQKVLINDIAAAKAFLDEKNDRGECNSGNLIVVGANEGATLGAIWINSEWHRYPAMPPQVMGGVPMPNLQNPQGRGVSCAVFLTLNGGFGSAPKETIRLSLPNTLAIAATTNKQNSLTPMAFFYGEKDEKGKTVAVACEKTLKDKNKTQILKAAMVPGVNASGRALLAKSLPTQDAICKFIEISLEGKINQPEKRDGKADGSIWQWQDANGRVVMKFARLKGGATPAYYSYDAFIRYPQ